MKEFGGFPEGPVQMVPMPGSFFTELLGSIDHLGEMKVTLYILWVLTRQEKQIRYLKRSEMQKDGKLLEALASPQKSGEGVLEEALERAVARGTFLVVRPEGSGDAFYFLNSARGRATAAGLQSGEWKPEQGESIPESLWVERPNIFTQYEQNIGPLTPLLAEILRDAEKEYPPAWIEEAIRIAVEHNARSWKYISAILERWKKEGLRERESTPEERRRRYIEGEYADFIEH